jgi:transcriptional regulator with XRE-family HTH domain
MPVLSELSSLVKQRRAEMGISQERLAQLAGLSRATVNELETGRIANLSLTRAERLANVLGYGLGVTGVQNAGPAGTHATAVRTAARTASVSYANALPPETLRKALLKGTVAPNYVAHLRSLLEEAPVGLLSAVAAQLQSEDNVPVGVTWQNMRQLARAVGCTRDIWS